MRREGASSVSSFNEYGVPHIGLDERAQTTVAVFDIADRAVPRLAHWSSLDGYHLQSRRIDDHLYLVLHESMTQPLDAGLPAAIEAFVPHFVSYSGDGKLARTGSLVQPVDIFLPFDNDATTMITVVSLNLKNDNPGPAHTAGVLTAWPTSSNLSASELYILTANLGWNSGPNTNILKFHLTPENGEVSLVATGTVPGTISNTFSIDAFQGKLLIVTQTSGFSRSQNNLFVLTDDNGVLELIGSRHSLAPYTAIQNVRFNGERAVVTTSSSDSSDSSGGSLIVLDLSDSLNPEVGGNLPLPSFPSYVQYMSPHYLLAIGPNRTNSIDFNETLVVLLLDVSKTDDPKLIDQYRGEYSSETLAGLAHLGFGWFSAQNILAVPVTTTKNLRVDQDQDGYAETRRTERTYHLDLLKIDVAHEGLNDAGIRFQGRIQTDVPVLRGFSIGETIYAVTHDSITSAKIASPNEVLDEISIIPARFVALQQNLNNRFDTDGNGQVTPRDVLLIVRAINRSQRDRRAREELVRDLVAIEGVPWTTIPMLDVNGDGKLSPRDALHVIRRFQRDASFAECRSSLHDECVCLTCVT